ncbi:DEAD/DEAH box helicase [Ginsengibacter hankyongi]|uniref:DEAD/DEAH box helicase n=1 Tax=Ginsengibacter hankyongi TaxID=2607284 RepID=A0A5J5ILW3_9BACT|nr:DEAD/DEAH box helicase [Ginsengibacter hankyongi]KAA9041959.1 DEAD/DEAH box helicase [Ginsengibacter hankyongi]
MALPHLIKYVYNSGTDEVIRRGKKIHSSGYVELVEHDELMHTVTFRIKDDSYATFYKVTVQKYDDPKSLSVRCTCPYNLGDICRHEAAALFQLQDLVDRNLLTSDNISVYNQKHTVIKMKFIDLKTIRMLTGPDNYEAAEVILRTNKLNILSAKNERVEASLDIDGEKYYLIVQKNEEKNFDTSCTCSENLHALCEHKTTLFLHLLNAYGPYYFDSIRNWDKEKNKLLELYGYSLNEELSGKFEFIYKDGKPFLKVLDPSIKKITPVTSNFPKSYEPVTQSAEIAMAVAVKRKKVAIVFNANQKEFPFFSIDAIQGDYDEDGEKFIGRVEKLDLGKFINTDVFSIKDKQLIQQARKLQQSEINKYLNRNSPFSGFWENIIQQENEELPEETKLLITEYIHPKLKKIFQEQNITLYLPAGKKFNTENLQSVVTSDVHPFVQFEVAVKDDEYFLNAAIRINNETLKASDNQWDNFLLFLYDQEIFLWKKAEDALIAKKFNKTLHISENEWPSFLKEVIMPLTKEYEVKFDDQLVKETKDGQPDISLMLIEKGDYLLFQPVYSYKGFNVRPGDKETIIVPEDGKILMVHRNKEAEQEFHNKLAGLHSQFSTKENGSLVLKGTDVLKNNWFFLFVDAMKEMKIPVSGFNALKNFRFNTAKPSTQIHLSSGLDWFDAKIELSFGEQRIGISEIKKALINKQSFVQLNDGSLGILPDEWINKYSLLFKVGQGKENKLRLSKFHLSVIDDLYEKRDEKELSFELDEKYARLRNFKSIPETEVPQELENKLRPYQVSGFNWLNYLKSVGWGGILADDMGLGKTVQALSMLSHYAKEEGGLKALVVCPTTLIYNWENEIRKFTPSLTWCIHHGSLRTRNPADFENYNVIITTYGTLRSDIQLMMKILFDYVILDESQAIKNPSSKVTKAACLLTSKNRLCMSGTPLQNNTFDVYAQMNFLNPGLLGSVEFFRNEFSTPIDKFGEQEQKDHLRKLLYPFILRRTKEQVAKDLPEKTETILFCEMEDEQKEVYDAYRNVYRDKIMGVIEGEGIDKSQLTILQGLMKLRQICDSPAILNEEEKYPNHSIKLDELTREITENIGEHKALIFSQFLGMLALIKEKLTENNIEFDYFDGSTPPQERERSIQNFQTNDNSRVFLISLKAGGVGLNLTAADYVYIVDPWWNPAVEQQAIDRTHRIGQTKNIFAYRMICKDTIEDKILQLQERKRTLAKELISDDQTFVKSLSKEDVEYLFS